MAKGSEWEEQNGKITFHGDAGMADYPPELEEIVALLSDDVGSEKVAQTLGNSACGIRGPLAYDRENDTLGFYWDPSKPVVVSPSLCTDANTWRVEPRSNIASIGRVAKCRNGNFSYYRLVVRNKWW